MSSRRGGARQPRLPEQLAALPSDPVVAGSHAAHRAYRNLGGELAYLKAQQEYARLPTAEARAVCAHTWVRICTGAVEQRWTLLYQSLAVIRDTEAYRRPELVGGQVYSDFPAYFEAAAKQPFARFAEMEATLQVLQSAGYTPEAVGRLRYGEARTKALAVQASEEEAQQRRDGRPSKAETFDNIQSFQPAPTGTSAKRALRRLRQQRPDLHARVLAGECSPNAAMVEAGFRPRMATVPLDDIPRLAATLHRRLQAEQFVALLVALEALR